MDILQILSSQFTFDGEHFFNNYISIGNLQIKFYALCIMTGMILCAVIGSKLFKQKEMNPDLLLDFLIAIIPLAIIGARAWYVINAIDEFDTFLEVINIRNGGLAIIGGVMGGALAVFIVCKIKKVKFLQMADISCVMLPLGQAIGRWGNFFNMEVYGGVSSFESFPLAVYIGTQSSGEWHVPLFLIESLLNLGLFILLFLLFRKKNIGKNGYYMSFYFIGYGLIRTILEPLRDPTFNLTGVSGSGVLTQQLTAMLIVLLGIGCIIYFMYRDKKLIFKNVQGNDGKWNLIAVEGGLGLNIIIAVLLSTKIISVGISSFVFLIITLTLTTGLIMTVYGIIKKDWGERAVGIWLLAVSVVTLLFALEIPVVVPIVVASLFVLCCVLYMIFVYAPRLEKEKNETKPEQEN